MRAFKIGGVVVSRYGVFMICILFLIILIYGGNVMAFELKSTAFQHGESIPEKYTCKGVNISPPITWTGSPQGTKSFALICDDPDAPFITWVHWVIYGISSNVNELPEGIAKEKTIEGIGIQGKNSFRKIGYGGPCPPGRKAHRYFFKLYALDIALDLKPGIKKKELMNKIKDHIIEKAELMGRYKK
jgi:Raf kinase inhibitor-like YbhB/YbcL family protein